MNHNLQWIYLKIVCLKCKTKTQDPEARDIILLFGDISNATVMTKLLGKYFVYIIPSGGVSVENVEAITLDKISYQKYEWFF